MREIKFRAWDNFHKFMTHKVLVGNTDSSDINYTAHCIWIEPELVDYKREPGWMNFDEHSNIILMQYTGLSDKNGVEIYEGDIVTFLKYHEKYVIEFKDGAYRASSLVYEGMGQILTYWNEKVNVIEVVGNIYENGESK